MNHDKFEQKNMLAHLQGQLKKGEPRKVMNYDLIKHLSQEDKLSMTQVWTIKMEVPVMDAGDCDKAMSWIQTRIFNFTEAGFHHLGTEAAIKERSFEGGKRDEPFWFIHVIHPEYKDPREHVKKCVAYEHIQ